MEDKFSVRNRQELVLAPISEDILFFCNTELTEETGTQSFRNLKSSVTPLTFTETITGAHVPGSAGLRDTSKMGGTFLRDGVSDLGNKTREQLAGQGQLWRSWEGGLPSSGEA